MADSLKQDLVGALVYSIYVDGEEVESVDADDPVEYLHGYDNIVPGLEKALQGLRVGDKFDVEVPPKDAFGDYDDEDIDEIPRDEFDYDDEEGDLEVGLEVELLDEDGDIIEGTIVELRGDMVVVDFNHPLAGKAIRYSGEVVGIREATEEELEWGYAESFLDEYFGDDDLDLDLEEEED